MIQIVPCQPLLFNTLMAYKLHTNIFTKQFYD